MLVPTMPFRPGAAKAPMLFTVLLFKRYPGDQKFRVNSFIVAAMDSKDAEQVFKKHNPSPVAAEHRIFVQTDALKARVPSFVEEIYPERCPTDVFDDTELASWESAYCQLCYSGAGGPPFRRIK